ncbi:MAG TPA: hypothetical protein VFB54_04495 [Burkholderiales bacterium]|nr:hypothetical protein [Burkholderiales bacterium]
MAQDLDQGRVQFEQQPRNTDERELQTGTCEVCGNEYEGAFYVIAAGQRHVFDSFECAIHRLAPVCEHCNCKIIGHGVESGGHFFCCANCARHAGVSTVADHV